MEVSEEIVTKNRHTLHSNACNCLERNICEMRLSSVDSLVNGEYFLFNTYVAYIAFSGANLGFSRGSRSHFRLNFIICTDFPENSSSKITPFF